MLQDLPETPKYLLTFTVGVSQKEGVNEAVKKVRWWILMMLYIYCRYFECPVCALICCNVFLH